MGTRATGTFEIETWDEKPYDEQEGARLTRTHLTKTFRGDVEGESTCEMLMAYAAEEGSGAYADFERITGRVHGWAGSFVLHHSASSAGSCDERSGTWSVCLAPGQESCAACAARR